MTASANLAKVSALIAEAQVYAKFIAATVGGLLIIAAQFLPPEAVTIATIIVAAVTAFSVYKFPNADASPKHSA